MGGSRSATSEEGVSLLWEAQACREACSIITGHDHLRRGHFLHQVSLGGRLALNGLPPLHVYVSQSGAGLGGSTMQTRMLSQVEAQLLQLRFPHYPEVFHTYRQKLFIQSSSYKALHTRTKENSPPSKEERNARDSKPTQDLKEKCPQRQEIRSCSICLISNTF